MTTFFWSPMWIASRRTYCLCIIIKLIEEAEMIGQCYWPDTILDQVKRPWTKQMFQSLFWVSAPNTVTQYNCTNKRNAFCLVPCMNCTGVSFFLVLFWVHTAPLLSPPPLHVSFKYLPRPFSRLSPSDCGLCSAAETYQPCFRQQWATQTPGAARRWVFVSAVSSWMPP